MFRVQVLATRGEPAAALLRILEKEGISYSVINGAPVVDAGPGGGGVDAVLVDGSACELQDVSRAIERCRDMGLAILCGLTPGQLDEYEVAWGANDFFITPPLLGEVTIRLKQLAWEGQRGSGEDLVRVGDLVIDLERYEVSAKGRRVLLTFKEYQLLHVLASNPGRVYTREALLSEVWGYDYFGGTRTVDVHIRRLRSKIEDGGSVYIETVRNVGYRCRPWETPPVGM